MWRYEKRLQYPVKIHTPNARLAKAIISQMGGPDGELAASQRYLSQRYSMPWRDTMAVLTDIGTEELAHLEIVSTIIRQLTRDLDICDIKEQGFDGYYVDHTIGVWPQAAGGTPFTATYFQSKGDPITDLHENLAAEQKARTTYDNLIRLADDPAVLDPLRFLREREIVHYQRFGEANHTHLSGFQRMVKRFSMSILYYLYQKTNRQDSFSLTVCYMFQIIFALPFSLMTI